MRKGRGELSNFLRGMYRPYISKYSPFDYADKQIKQTLKLSNNERGTHLTKEELMDIKLNDKYSLKSDTYNFWIAEDRISENGKPYEMAVSGYHGAIEPCLTSYIDRKLRKADCESLKELRDLVTETKQEIHEFMDAIDEAFIDMRVKEAK